MFRSSVKGSDVLGISVQGPIAQHNDTYPARKLTADNVLVPRELDHGIGIYVDAVRDQGKVVHQYR
jgi:hypothetical protein